ncbi:MAG: biotin/lipoyl-binding protein [Actinobacteria bacterium]|nr:biotin/lipoyl-binding protein [Actinomycetota bacterium]
MPSGGELHAFKPPTGPGIRNDAGVETGDEVSLDYDPMLAKLIVSGPDRDTAVLRLRRALEDYSVLGVTTNMPLLRRVVEETDFAAGETTTSFLEEHGLDEPVPEPPPPREALLLAASGEIAAMTTTSDGDPFAAGPWRLGGTLQLVYRGADGEEYVIEAGRAGRGRAWRLVVDGEASLTEVKSLADGVIWASIDGRILEGGFAADGRSILVSVGSSACRLERPAAPDVDHAGADAADQASLTAPMPGTVVKVLVGEGDEVEEGQTLLVLEAMKMEQSVAAPHAGRVKALPYSEGARVPGGAVLAEIESQEHVEE